ncbi:hypothetical protein GALL_548510 [mine drainage metagenome]|uniref:Uncharacterized protein n=1 Tax=mine drainage metagenome TaxID=410659 RepID=A0A1J5NZD7_9ZZZZ
MTIEIDSRVIQRLQRPDGDAEHQRAEADQPERQHQALFRSGLAGFAAAVSGGLWSKDCAHDLAPVMSISPSMAWCPMPQYSLQMM